MDGIESPTTIMGLSKAHLLKNRPLQEANNQQPDPEEDDDDNQQNDDGEQDASAETEGQGQPRVDVNPAALIGHPGIWLTTSEDALVDVPSAIAPSMHSEEGGNAIISDTWMATTDHALDRRSADMEGIEESQREQPGNRHPFPWRLCMIPWTLVIPSSSGVDPGPVGTQGWSQVMDIVAKADAQEALERQKKQKAHLATFSKFKKDRVKTNFAGDTEDSLDNLEVEDPVVSHPPMQGAKAANPGDGTSKFQCQPRTLKVGHYKASPFAQQPQPSDHDRPGPSMRAGSVTAKHKGKTKA
ncbi:hypothetical protein K439DRAFT_1619783 [Ramaria rubella]|nr:hypothetical protein K439DRAFT_1619783 [Ramaria rubella]